jgi:uncharacterized protein
VGRLYKFRDVFLFLNNHCNLKCSYCFLDDKYRYEIRTDVLVNALEFIKRHADPKRFHIHFFGTEPLLSWDKLYMALRWIDGHAPHWSRGITSNMTLMTYARGYVLAKNNVSVLASLDGAEESHNRYRRFRNNRPSFKRVLQGIRMFSYHSTNFGVAMTITPENLPHLVQNVQFVYDLNPRPQFIALNKIVDHWTTPYDVRMLRERLEEVTEWWVETDPDFPLQFLHKGCEDFARTNGRPMTKSRWTCGALFGSYAIRWDGKIFPCQRMTTDGWDIGDLDSGIAPEWVEFYRSLDFTQCHLCPVFSCGTCYVHNYFNTGTIHQIPAETCKFESIRTSTINEVYPRWREKIKTR